MKDFQSEISEFEFVGMIAMLMALVALAINMILPAFQVMTEHFDLTTSNEIGLSVSLLYAGLAVGQVVFGAMSDSSGRKAALSAGLVVFVAGSCLSFLSDNFVFFIVGQITQGIGLGAPRVVTLAVVRDKFEGAQMARIMSFIMVIFVLIPMIAPYLGQLITQQFGWRTIFLTFATAGAAMCVWLSFRLNETLASEDRSAPTISAYIRNLVEVTSSAPAMLYAAVLGIISAVFISYLNMSQQILQFQYGLGDQYPLYFAFMSLGIAAASYINSRIVVIYSLEKITIISLCSISGISISLALVTEVSDKDPSLIVLLAYLITMLFCFGILVNNLNAMAMRSLGNVAGMGAALVGALSTLLSVPLAIWVGGLYSGSVQPLIIAFGSFGLLSIGLYRVAGKLGQVDNGGRAVPVTVRECG